MDEARRLKVNYLSKCSFLPGSYEKRFVRDMAKHSEDYELSIRQAHYIDLLYWMYRKQIAAMPGNDKPEVYRPGELMVDKAVEKPSRRRARDKLAEAGAAIDEWNAKVMGENRDADS